MVKELKPGMVITLFGDIGSGKTTFVSYLAKALGFADRVQSPTFILIRHYKEKKKYPKFLNSEIKIINHIDLYRLSSKEEVLGLGIFEIIGSKDSLTLIEWPELIMEFLPANTPKVSFFVIGENKRKIIIENLL